MFQLSSRHSIGLGCVLALLASCTVTDGTEVTPAEQSAVSAQAIQAVDLEGTSNLGFHECATEGPESYCQAARFGSLVAFGANGQYNYKIAGNSALKCSTDVFGDPIQNVKKRCYFSVYRQVAVEDSLGWVGRKTNVAFGANGRFVFANVTGNYTCGLSTFGGSAKDPAPYVKKACYAPLIDYVFAADETVPPTSIALGANPRPVAYGANGKFAYRVLSGTVSCENDTFGDPIGGVQKACYVFDSGYQYFGAEDETLVFPAASRCTMTYTSGLGGASIVRQFLSSDSPVKCSNEAFGTDPAPQERKYCFGGCLPNGSGGASGGGASAGGATSR